MTETRDKITPQALAEARLFKTPEQIAAFIMAKDKWQARAYAAEKLLAKVHGQLMEADAVIAFFRDFDYFEGGRPQTPDERKWEQESAERHAAVIGAPSPLTNPEVPPHD